MENSQTNIRLYSILAAARVLGIGKDALYTLVADGKVGFVRIGKRKKIPYSELVRFQNDNIMREKKTVVKHSLTSKDIENIFNLSGRNQKKSLNGKEILTKIMRDK